MKYLLILIWLELIIVFATGCSSPRDYKTTEEIQEDWHRVYNELREEENEDIH